MPTPPTASEECITYRIDADNYVESINGPWSDFAEENCAAELSATEQLSGRSIWSFIRGTEIKTLYQQIFDEVRMKQTEFRMPFRCDSPNFQRNMSLTVSYAGENKLDVSSNLDQERSQLYVPLLEHNAALTKGYIDCCSVCRRFSDGNDVWLSAAELARDTNILAAARLPSIRERVCGDCADTAGVSYLISRSGETQSESQKVPLVVFLHGGAHQKNLMRLYAPPRLVSEGKLLDAPPFFLLSPIKKTGERWDSNKIVELVAACCNEYPIDCTRIYLTGISEGGVAVWNTVYRYPGTFAAALPISSINPNAGIAHIGHIPIWAIHGAKDSIFKSRQFLSSAKRLSKILPNLKWTLLSDRDHDVWSWTYNNRFVWNWVFAQCRTGTKELVLNQAPSSRVRTERLKNQMTSR